MYKGTIKIIVSGPSASGKTHFINNMCGVRSLIMPYGGESKRYLPTIGVDFYTTYMTSKFFGEDVNWKVYFWDTSGNRSFTNITKEFYRVCPICIIIYKPDQKDTISYYKDIATSQNKNIYILELENTNEPNFGKGMLPSIIESYSKTQPTNIINKLPLIKGLTIEKTEPKQEKTTHDNDCTNLLGNDICTIV